jgi:tryptophanyl-tRNA synthetase
VIDDNVATLPGLDGRKMSKSYDNTIPLFAPRGELKKLVAGIVTDSRAPGEPKDTEGSALFQLYQAFAIAPKRPRIRAGLRRRHRLGRRQADAVRTHRCRSRAAARKIRSADGQARRDRGDPARWRVAPARLSQVSTVDAKSTKKEASATVPTFKQYRDADGKFYFKLVQGERVLLQSTGFASPRDAGQRIAAIKQGEIGDGASDFALGEGVGDEEVNAALAAFVAAQLEGEAGKA